MIANKTYNLILAFDYGTSKIGVAVGQQITQTATPLAQITWKNNNWQLIDQVIHEWQPDAILIGIPTKMNGDWQKITTLAKAFANTVKTRYRVAVFEVDERLSTKSAKSTIFAASGYKGLQKNKVDSVAAAIILEQWMQEFTY